MLKQNDTQKRVIKLG